MKQVAKMWTVVPEEGDSKGTATGLHQNNIVVL